MSQNQKHDTFKEIIGTLKENYKTPGKVLLWGMVNSFRGSALTLDFKT